MVLMHWGGPLYVTVNDLHDAQKMFRAMAKNPHKIRVEGRFVQLYAEHKDWIERLSHQIKAYEWWEPEGLLQPNTVVMGETMAGWEYRITIGRNIPNSFGNWALKNIDKIKCGTKFKEALDNNALHWLTGLYFYVRSDKMLNLVSLILGPSIAQIDKIIIEDKNA